METSRTGQRGGVSGAGTHAVAQGRIGLRTPVSAGTRAGIPRRARPAGGPREATIVTQILTWLNQQPYTYARKTHGGGYSSGWPDIVGCHGGIFFAFEVKRPGGMLTTLQRSEMEKWWAAKGEVLLVYSLDEAKTFIRGAVRKIREVGEPCV